MTSYPYFRVARMFEVCYGKVLNFIDQLDNGLEVKIKNGERKLMLWELRAYDAWRSEHFRRVNAN